MKRFLKISVFLTIVLFVGVGLTGCRDRVFEEITYMANVPVYMTFEDFRAAVKQTSPKEMVAPGKIYFYNNYLFINENQQGVHVVDNSNPANPVKIAFIEIPGNVDIAIRGNVLYADSYIDLVAIDISNPQQTVEIDRIEGVFPNVIPTPDEVYPVYGLDFSKGVVVSWEKKEVTEVVERGNFGSKGEMLALNDRGAPMVGSADVSLIGQTTGIAGSMARFTIIDGYMYAVHNTQLKVINISQTPGIALGNALELNRNVETIYPFEGKLFLGTTTGMLVYDLANPATPEYVSVFEHITSCDPVVVSGQYAYVTLRSGNACNNMTNQLDVVDISSVQHPYLVKSYPFFNPHGLGIDGNTLFICDGEAGLKVFDVTDPQEILQHQLAHFPDIHSYDVIPVNGVLMMIGADGLYQYDYTDPTNLRLLSQLQVSAKP